MRANFESLLYPLSNDLHIRPTKFAQHILRSAQAHVPCSSCTPMVCPNLLVTAGGVKNATWLFKIRGSELSFATADGVIAFLLKKLQDPAVAVGAKAEAAVFAAGHGHAATSSGRCNNSAAGSKVVQRASKAGERVPNALPLPPAKKQCLSSPNAHMPSRAAAGAGSIASRSQQQHSAVKRSTDPQRRVSDSAHAGEQMHPMKGFCVHQYEPDMSVSGSTCCLAPVCLQLMCARQSCFVGNMPSIARQLQCTES